MPNSISYNEQEQPSDDERVQATDEISRCFFMDKLQERNR